MDQKLKPIQIHRLSQGIRDSFHEGIRDIVCGVDSLLIHYDLQVCRLSECLEELVELVLTQLSAFEGHQDAMKRVIEIPACYDESMGLDIGLVCSQLGICRDDLIELHGGRTYEVQAVGFTPGFAYMGEVDPKLVMPRRTTPRTRVPKGSIGIADVFTGIYPFQSPGGWNLIARTPIQVFDMTRANPCLFELGVVVRFVPISLEAYHHMDLQGGGHDA